jgi:antitoxin component of RelBE/YafQ-DinJ toxin-antitoxin module
MNSRVRITIDPELQRRAQAKAADLGLSFAGYVRQLLERDSGRPDISIMFDIVDEGPTTHIARDKDKKVSAAVRKEHARKSLSRRSAH